MQSLLFLLVIAAAGWVVWRLWDRLRRADRKRMTEARSEALAKQRTAEALDQPGTLPSEPIEVGSAAAIEPRAEAEPCPYCRGRLHTEEHTAEDHGALRLRRLTMKCGGCGRRCNLYFVLRLPN